MPELKNIAILQIAEPPLPVREAMDEHKLDELAESMREVGLVQPISVKPTTEGYEIVAGHRRYLAARKLGWIEIRCIVFAEGELKDEAAMLAENIHREDLTAAEEALWFSQLMEKRGIDTIALAKMVGQSQDYVEDRLNLFRGDQLVYEALRKREINFSVARELNKFKDDGQRLVHLDAAVRTGATARMVMKWRSDCELIPPQQIAATNGNSEASPPPPVTPGLPKCELCEADTAQYQMRPVLLHDWCWGHVKNAVRKAAEV